MKLRFTSITDKALSISGAVLQYLSGMQSEQTTTSTYGASNGESFTIYYKYDYEYIHKELWWGFGGNNGFKLDDYEYWTASKFLSSSGRQASPYPQPRIKSEHDDLLYLEAAGDPYSRDRKTKTFNEMDYTSWKFNLSVKIELSKQVKPWAVFKGDIPLGISSTLNHYKDVDIVYEFRNLDNKPREWDMYFWNSNVDDGKGYVITFGEDANSPPGGGGCPYISTWDGTSYICDNNILPASESSNGSDVADYYVIQQPIYRNSPSEPFRVRVEEFEHEHSWLDFISMLMVEHPSGTSLAISPDGRLMTFAQPAKPLLAIGPDEQDLTQCLSHIGGGHFHGYQGDAVVISFERPRVVSVLKLVIRADFKTQFGSIRVQIPSNESWVTYSIIHPRELWSYEIVDLSEVSEVWTDKVVVRLLWTAEHKIDFVGLDTSSPVELKIHELKLISAVDNQGNNVRRSLKQVDQHYAQLLPGNYINLTFKPVRFKSPGSTYDFVIHAVGHYLPLDDKESTVSSKSYHLNSENALLELDCLDATISKRFR